MYCQTVHMADFTNLGKKLTSTKVPGNYDDLLIIYLYLRWKSVRQRVFLCWKNVKYSLKGIRKMYRHVT